MVRRMFADIEADIYVLVDGDDTNNAANSPEMINLLADDQCVWLIISLHFARAT